MLLCVGWRLTVSFTSTLTHIATSKLTTTSYDQIAELAIANIPTARRSDPCNTDHCSYIAATLS